MYSTILLVALSTVGGHKCHGCYSSCSVAPACNGGCAAAVVCNGCSACSCHKVRRHKCGLFRKLFNRKCHCASSCNGGCNGGGCYSDCGHVSDCCNPCGNGHVIDCASGCAAPAAEPAPAPAPEAAPAPAPAEAPATGFKVNRSSLLEVSYEDRAEFSDEPIVIFARS